MLLVDTNIVANLVLNGPFSTTARALYLQDPDWTSEPLLFVELTNVFATGLRLGQFSRSAANAALERAHSVLDDHLHFTSDLAVLDIASRYGISGYDARFVCAALDTRSRLVTEDVRLRRKVPDATRSIADALGG